MIQYDAADPFELVESLGIEWAREESAFFADEPSEDVDRLGLLKRIIETDGWGRIAASRGVLLDLHRKEVEARASDGSDTSVDLGRFALLQVEERAAAGADADRLFAGLGSADDATKSAMLRRVARQHARLLKIQTDARSSRARLAARRREESNTLADDTVAHRGRAAVGFLAVGVALA
jgi:hypothetical protein